MQGSRRTYLALPEVLQPREDHGDNRVRILGPLDPLYRGQLIGRLEAHIEGDELVVDKLWKEKGHNLPARAYRTALRRHQNCLRSE